MATAKKQFTTEELKRAQNYAGEMRRRGELYTHLEDVIGAAIEATEVEAQARAKIPEHEKRLAVLSDSIAEKERELQAKREEFDAELKERRAAVDAEIEQHRERSKKAAHEAVVEEQQKVKDETEELKASRERGARAGASRCL